MAEGSYPSGPTQHDFDEDPLDEHVYDPGDPDGVVAAEQKRIWQEKHPNPPATPPAKQKQKKRWPLTLLGVLVLAAIVYGAYSLGTHNAGKNQPASTSPASTKTQSQQTTQQPATVQTKHYSSTNFGLSFDYPSDWTVGDTTAKLTVTSPSMQLMTAVGAKTDAHVVVTIQNQQTTIPGFPGSGAVASLASDQLTYKQPSTVQRAQTYLSYLSYTQPNGLDALYLTGDKGYQQSQAVPISDIVGGNPLISTGFQKCSVGNCTGSSDFVTLQASSWKSSQAGKDVMNLLESIVISDQ